MQKVTAFSKTKFCSSRDIVIISFLHFMSKQLKLKLVSCLCLLSGRGLPVPAAAALFVLWVWRWMGREDSSIPIAKVPFWLALEICTQLVGVNQLEQDGDILLGVRILSVRLRSLKAAQWEVAAALLNCRLGLGRGFQVQLWFIAWPWTNSVCL